MQLMEPVRPDQFAACMAAAGPFEPEPHLAVGVSGGGDSMALALLLADWCRQRGGRLLALTVDHGLRPDSGQEAAQVAAWMRDRGIDHQILAWEGCKPTTGIQAGARTARLRLLAGPAAAQGILHLALAHHADDQAETALLRQARGSGGDGLAGMPLIRELGPVRLIRPLLPVPKTRLLATCRGLGQAWVEDPSNRDSRYARVALRQQGPDTDSAFQDAAAAGQARAMLDQALAGLAARHVRFQPEGWAMLSAGIVSDAAAMGPRLLTSLLRAIGGAAYPPSPSAVAALWQRMVADARTGATLAGCRLAATEGGWQLMREERHLEGPVPVPPGGSTVTWDGRFRLSIQGTMQGQVQALDDLLWQRATALEPALKRAPLAAAIRRTCPVLTERGEICAIPHLGFNRADRATLSCYILPEVAVPAFGPRFAVVSAANDII